ncbi:MAG: GAF domain-containing sensor histidine kinase [Planctomycetes bacterium]|nr:GAF domain-containing sensor histidine kinase [Planctomycetota bacterium]
MVQNVISPPAEQDRIDQVSWELMSTYEALSSLASNADHLALTGDIYQAAKNTLTQSIGVTESDSGLFFIYRQSGFECLASHNATKALYEEALEKSRRCGNKHRYDDTAPHKYRALDGTEINSSIYVPFFVGEQRPGFIVMFSTDQRIYTSIDVRITQTLCGQGALAIRCLLHLQELEEKNEVLQETLHALQETQDKLINSERLSALGQMASMIVHDLKNPMGGMLGYAQLLETLADNLTPEEIREYSGIIVHEIQRLSSMTEEIMDFSRGLDIHLNQREVTARDMVAVAAPIIASEFTDSGICLDWESVDNNAMILVDTDKMERVLINLAMNAQQAMEVGGSFTITSQVTGEHLVLVLCDSGNGIAEELRDKIFEPFHTSRPGSGSGIGLAVARWVVQAHGGDIWLEKTGSEGSEFRLRIPL